ncbi:MAG: hypothetical protein IPI49_07225 [Myxococcales bacterium]|nr:hypothetical protein [Myxococcales bacterium]
MTPPRLLEDPQASALAKTLLRAGQDEEPSAPRRAALAGALGLGSLAGAHAVSSAAVVSSAAPWKLAVALVVGASLGVLGVASWTPDEVSLATRATRRAKVATAAGDGAATTARAAVAVTAPASLAVPSPAATPNASGAPTLAVSTNGAPALAVSTNGAPALAVSTGRDQRRDRRRDASPRRSSRAHRNATPQGQPRSERSRRASAIYDDRGAKPRRR